jgi:glucokinase
MTLIGVDIGGTSIKSALVNEKGDILYRFSFKVEATKSQEEIVQQIIDSINQALTLKKLDKKQVKGVGIGCPGSINSGRGTCDYSNNLHWENLPIAALVEKGTGIPTKIANDANAAALGEAKFGVGGKYRNLVLLTLGTGVGSGLYLNGQLYEGNEGKGAELGHTTLVMDGRPCTCGRKGCVEAYCSVSALNADTKEMMKKDPSSSMWSFVNGKLEAVNGLTAFECAKKGDKSAQKVVDQYIHFLGEELLNVMNAFRPEAIVLGGGLSGQREALTEPLKKYLAERGYGFAGTHAPKAEILVSRLGNDAGILGAASLVL